MSTFRSSFAPPKPLLHIKDENPYYAVVRHSADGHDWLDTSTMSGSPEVAQQAAQRTDAQLPQWASVNKYIAIVAVTIRLKEPVNER